MKKTGVVLGSIFALLLGACIPIPGFTPTPATGPTVDSAGTSDALFKTAVAQTLTAQPTPTSVTATNTVTLAVASSPVVPATDTPPSTPSATLTPLVDLTNIGATATGNIPTATGAIANATSTPTLAAGQVTAIWTLAIRKYGTQPPLVPFSHITLINKANAEAYISLHVDLPEGGNSVIEYPVKGRIKIEAPVGFYRYVTWVGGRKMVGAFRLHQNDEISITLYKDRVVIK
ncbi:MAG TPA: hypothetical protein VF896_10900 [Anaerolineales bacterium]